MAIYILRIFTCFHLTLLPHSTCTDSCWNSNPTTHEASLQKISDKQTYSYTWDTIWFSNTRIYFYFYFIIFHQLQLQWDISDISFDRIDLFIVSQLVVKIERYLYIIMIYELSPIVHRPFLKKYFWYRYQYFRSKDKFCSMCVSKCIR